MSVDTRRSRPSALEYLIYCYGYTLPESMRDWVRNDVAGKGAARRMVVRVTVPVVLMLAPMWLIPTSLYVHAGMTVPIFIPFIYFSIALNRVYRRHKLAQHGLDPGIVDDLRRVRDADIHRAYEARYRTHH